MGRIRIQLINDSGVAVEEKEIETTDVLACVVYGEVEAKLLAQEKKIKKLVKPNFIKRDKARNS